MSLLLRTTYTWYEYEGFYPYASEEGDSLDSVLNRDFTRGETWANEIQLTAQLSDWNQLVTGFEYRDNFNLDQQNYNEFPYELFSDDRRSQEIWALYVQDEIRLAPWARLTLGVRHDDYSLVGGTTNPRAGLVLLPQQNFAVKLLYGSAFRAPNAYELFYDDIADINKPNPNLEPEEIDTWEIVSEYYFSKNSRLVTSAFWYEIDDLIGSGVDPTDGQIVFTNGAGATATGGVIEFSARFIDGWFMRTSYGFVETEDSSTGMRLSNSPRHVGKAFLSIPLADKLYLSPGARFVSRRVLSEDASRSAGSCLTVDATLLQEDLLPGLSLAGSVYNLFDRTCRDPVGTEISQGAVSQDGRVLRAELRWKFGAD
jgi:iron complex outermembrane receptor protein